jgi:hypothetical protein
MRMAPNLQKRGGRGVNRYAQSEGVRLRATNVLSRTRCGADIFEENNQCKWGDAKRIDIFQVFIHRSMLSSKHRSGGMKSETIGTRVTLSRG